MIRLRRIKHNKRRKGINSILVAIDHWNTKQIEITLYTKNMVFKNNYFDYIPKLHQHLLYRNGTMKEKRKVFSEQINSILGTPKTPK